MTPCSVCKTKGYVVVQVFAEGDSVRACPNCRGHGYTYTEPHKLARAAAAAMEFPHLAALPVVGEKKIEGEWLLPDR